MRAEVASGGCQSRKRAGLSTQTKNEIVSCTVHVYVEADIAASL